MGDKRKLENSSLTEYRKLSKKRKQGSQPRGMGLKCREIDELDSKYNMREMYTKVKEMITHKKRSFHI